METSSKLQTIYDCPFGIPEYFLRDPLPVEIKNVDYSGTVAKVTVLYQGFEDHEMTAFYNIGCHGFSSIRQVFLVRIDPNYDFSQDINTHQPIKKEIKYSIEPGTKPIFASLYQSKEDLEELMQQALARFCVLI